MLALALWDRERCVEYTWGVPGASRVQAELSTCRSPGGRLILSLPICPEDRISKRDIGGAPAAHALSCTGRNDPGLGGEAPHSYH